MRFVSDERCDLLCLDVPLAESVRASQPSPALLEQAASRAAALADPTRLRIAAALRAGDELCVCDLSWIVGRAQNLVSHHVRALRSAGLACSRREGKLVLYALTDEGRRLVDSVLPAVAVPAS
jgi:ArsR family transcriptional regulator, lead/cadmium/zinc/bismuth-responsive transcriptional repressor